MIVWTVQPWSVWIQLKTHDTINTVINNSDLLDLKHKYSNLPSANELRAYQWMIKQMSVRISPSPNSAMYPYWCWHTWNGQHKLFLKEHRYYNNQAVIELDIPDSKILLSDFDKWNFALNNWFLPSSIDDENVFEKENKEFERKPSQSAKEASWEHIFDVTGSDFVQGCFWQLKYDKVVKVYHQNLNHHLKIIVPKRRQFAV